MRVKTSELSGAALDWAVAKLENNTSKNADTEYFTRVRAEGELAYSADWSWGGPIIEREKLCITVDHSSVWIAYSEQNYADEKRFMYADNTPLVAAMRTYVASKLGDEVDVPDELV